MWGAEILYLLNVWLVHLSNGQFPPLPYYYSSSIPTSCFLLFTRLAYTNTHTHTHIYTLLNPYVCTHTDVHWLIRRTPAGRCPSRICMSLDQVSPQVCCLISNVLIFIIKLFRSTAYLIFFHLRPYSLQLPFTLVGLFLAI